MSDPTLARRIEANRSEQDEAQNQRNKQRAQKRAQEEAQRQQLEQEYQEYLKTQAQTQAQLQQLKKQEAERLAKEQFVNDIRSTTKTKIAELEAKRAEYIQLEKTTGESYQSSIRNMNYQIEKARTDEFKQISYLDYSDKYGNRPLTQSEYRSFESWAKEGVSLNQIVARREEARETERLYNIKSSQTTAKSDAIKAENELEKLKRDFESKKDKTPNAQNITNLTSKYDLTKATKVKPGIKPSSYFLDITDPSGTPYSIIGTTESKSKQAVQTFETTQEQQSRLFAELTASGNYKEAINIKSRYQEANPYVGTPQAYLYKGGIVDTHGVLIEKKLNEKFEGDTIVSYSPIKESKQGLTPIIESNIVRSDDGKIPTYIFLDENGNAREVTDQELWQYITKQANQGYTEASQTDKELNKYIQDNLEEIKKTEQTENTGEAKLLIDTKKPGIASGVLGHANEIYASAYNIIHPDKQIEYEPTLESYAFSDIIEGGKHLILGSEKPKESLFVKEVQTKLEQPGGMEYLVSSGLTSLAIGASTVILPPLAYLKYGQHFVKPKTIKEATQIIIDILTPKHKTLSTAREIELAQNIKRQIPKPKPTNQYNVELIDEKNPKKALISIGTETNPVRTPYIVYESGRRGKSAVYSIVDSEKPLTPQTLIIKGQQNPTITKVVKNENVGTITQKGTLEKKTTQLNELQGTKVLQTTKKSKSVFKEQETGSKGEIIPAKTEKSTYTETITESPASLKNLKKTVDNPNLQLVGSKKNVLSKDLKDNPKEVIENIINQDVKRESALLETEVKNPQKGIVSELENKAMPGTVRGKYETNLETKSKTTTENLDKEFEKLNPSKGTSASKTTRSYSEGKFKITDDSKIINPTDSNAKLISKPGTQSAYKKEKLKEYVKDLSKENSSVNLKTYSAQGVGMVATQGTRSKTKSGTKTSQSQKLIDNQIALTKSKLYSGAREIEITKEMLIDKLNENQINEPYLSPKYSLIVEPGQGQKTGIVPKVIITTAQKQEEKLKTPEPKPDEPIPDEPFKTPGLTPDISLEKRKEKINIDNIKSGKGYFIWNVDTERPGVYLPTKSLHVGKTKKVIKKVEQLQRKTHQQSYAKRLAKKEKAYFKLNIKEKRKQVKPRKDDIPFISKPKGKKAKKFLKKFNFKMEF